MKDYMKHYVGQGFIDKKIHPIICNAVLLKKRIIVDGKKKIRRRFVPYKSYFKNGKYCVLLPSLGIILKKRNYYFVTDVISWLNHRINLDGYEIYATSSGWNHGCKAIDKDWLLPNKGQ